MAIYLFYYIGVAGGATVEDLMNDGATTAYLNIFGGAFGNILNLFCGDFLYGYAERTHARLYARDLRGGNARRGSASGNVPPG